MSERSQEMAKRDWRKDPPECFNCGDAAELVTGKEVYPHRPDLHKGKYWICYPCNAYVGTHKGSTQAAPLGLLATDEHRKLKMQAHAAFDPIWRSRELTRSEAYAWLKRELRSARSVHIGWSTPEELEEIIKICRERKAARWQYVDPDDYQDIHSGKI